MPLLCLCYSTSQLILNNPAPRQNLIFINHHTSLNNFITTSLINTQIASFDLSQFVLLHALILYRNVYLIILIFCMLSFYRNNSLTSSMYTLP
jgi:hypothetical protein